MHCSSSITHLDLEDFRHSYETAGSASIAALKGVTINDLEPGEICMIVGPNGAGKSTLIERAAGILKGNGTGNLELTIDGNRVEEVEPGQQGKIRHVYIPQRPVEGLVPSLSVGENIVFRKVAIEGGSFQGTFDENMEREVGGTMRELGTDILYERWDSPPDSLSGGEQQLLNIASALYADCQILFADEPASRLDERNRIRVWNLLKKAAKVYDCIIVAASHDRDVVERIADRIIHLADGSKSRKEHRRKLNEERFVGAIRLVEDIEELEESKRPSQKWWAEDSGLFGQLYYEGDDSIGGYLSDRRLSRDERTEREVRAVEYICKDITNPLLLDVACGWGRHSERLSEKGYRVIGLDSSYKYLSKVAAGESEYVNGDMRYMPVDEGTVDIIYNMWTSFGFFNDEDNRRVLKEWAGVLTDGGRILVHTDHNPRRVKKGIFDEPSVRNLRDNGRLEVEEVFCQGDSRVYGSWSVERQGSSRSQAYSIAVYDEAWWKKQADRLGLNVIGFFGDLKWSPLGDRDQEFVVVLEKVGDDRLA